MSLSSTSKFLSLVLRHQPEVIGMQLDSEGWLPIDALIEGANRHGERLSLELLYVATISMWWCSSEYLIREACRNAVMIAREHKFASVAFSLIGAGTAGGSVDRVEKLMTDQLGMEEYTGRIIVVRYKKFPSPA